MTKKMFRGRSGFKIFDVITGNDTTFNHPPPIHPLKIFVVITGNDTTFNLEPFIDPLTIFVVITGNETIFPPVQIRISDPDR
jgi:hypothetical protein